MALTDAQKADVRRHLGYGLFGDTGNGGSFISYRFFVHHGLLEYRIQHLRAEEEVILLGSGDPDNPANPQILDQTNDVVYDGYLNICNFLEGQVGLASDNFDIKIAGDYEARMDEMQSRISLYNYYRLQMAKFLELPIRQYPYGGSACMVN